MLHKIYSKGIFDIRSLGVLILGGGDEVFSKLAEGSEQRYQNLLG